MRTPPYFEKMHSGNLCIILEAGVEYESFALAAERWAKTLGLKIVTRADGLDAWVWSCTRNENNFWLSFDHYLPTIGLEPKDAGAAAEIFVIGKSLGLDAESSVKT